jgi:Bacterial antitoxin of type II TA system, VapB
MATRLDGDRELLQVAIDLDHEATTSTIVEKALREYIQRRQSLKQKLETMPVCPNAADSRIMQRG